jgi:glucan-binding YG repeat protein
MSEYVDSHMEKMMFRMQLKKKDAQLKKKDAQLEMKNTEIHHLKNFIDKLMKEPALKEQIYSENIERADIRNLSFRDSREGSLNRSIRKSNQQKITQALSPLPKSSYHRKKNSFHSKKNSLRRYRKENANRVTPFTKEIQPYKSYSTFTTPRKESINESSEVPYTMNITPEQPPVKKTCTLVTPEKHMKFAKRDTSPRSSNINRMNNPNHQASNEEFTIKVTRVEGEERFNNSRMQRGSSSQCRIAAESPVRPIQELLETVAQGSSFDKREGSQVSEAQKSTASESKQLTKSTLPHSYSPFTSQNISTDTRGEKISERKSQEEKKMQIGKYKGQAKPFGMESSDGSSSEMEYQCMNTSNCEASDNGRLTGYDDSLIVGWFEENENPSP